MLYFPQSTARKSLCDSILCSQLGTKNVHLTKIADKHRHAEYSALRSTALRLAGVPFALFENRSGISNFASVHNVPGKAVARNERIIEESKTCQIVAEVLALILKLPQ